MARLNRCVRLILLVCIICTILRWITSISKFPAFSISPDCSKFISKINNTRLYRRNITKSPLTPNYNLWSRRADSVDWSVPIGLCQSILASDNWTECLSEMGRNWKVPDRHHSWSIAPILSNCTSFFDSVPFLTRPASREEAEYPLAYVVVGDRNAAQTVRLFRMIYQPQNAYCFVYDNASSTDYILSIQRLVKCFPGNVVLIPEPVPIGYGNIELLHSELWCMKELLDMWKKVRWKYVQVISWNDFPLKTNLELVRIFKILNGSQDSPLLTLTLTHFAFRRHPRPLPDGLALYKGSHATSMTKQFIQFVFTNPTVAKLYKWMEGSWAAEELYWSTIIHNFQLNAPGAFPGQCLYYYLAKNTTKMWASRYEVWVEEFKKCKGKLVHWSCVFGFLDIPNLIRRPEFVAHKVYDEFQPATTFCLEQWYWEKVRKSIVQVNQSYYESFPSVRYHRTKDKSKFDC